TPGDDHPGCCNQIGNGGEKTDSEVRKTEGLEHLWHPKADAIQPDHQTEIEEFDDARICDGLPTGVIALSSGLFCFSVEQLLERAMLFRREPMRILRPVGEESQGGDAEEHGRDALEDEHPPPSGNARKAMQSEQRG